MTDTLTESAAPTPAHAPATRHAQRPRKATNRGEGKRPTPAPARTAPANPVLEQLATLYPALFGPAPLPLKRGIFQDLLDAHPDAFAHETLKAALSQHTRSTRYLTVVASGQQRHDLQGQAVEAMAPEHVHHALLEVFRRRHNRTGEDVRPKLHNRMIQAFEASGLSREAYAALVHSRDEAANALLEEALAEATARAARDEALLRAFEASNQPVEAFADMYGMDPRTAAPTLERARRRRGATPATPATSGDER